ncbi:thioesterase II family protein [Amycolatopsis australiensis]|uniref:Surfactin synthase thioesterase subunit n=1 Tax=Amycolatopsis australiensis TaxID=546364 RepID=A0A1K1RV85_9PSEU|nr:alpha/beta fold hydrolase [Amycolatopsis australiensis]SFW75725.1 Surfactin synthase thioesterase subunit [Amycolatopsis australiensis]
MTDDPDRWLRRYHDADEGAVQLFCLPHAGGSASFYHPMSAGLGRAVDVVAVQYPGRQDRRAEPGIDSLPVLADRLAEVLAGRAGRPYALFGHSMGATLAFEVATRLERAGTGPRHLFASGRRAPACRRDESVHLLDDDGMLAELRRLGGTDAAVLGDEEILRMALPAIRNDYTAAETYVHAPGPKLRTPVTVLTGDADPKTTLAEARAWQDHTDGEFELKVFRGGHFFLADHQAEVLRLISARLAGTFTGHH